MKKSVLAIATAAAVAAGSILTPVAGAQRFAATTFDYPATPYAGEVRPNTPIQDGDASDRCETLFHAGVIIDPRMDNPANSGYTYKVKTPHAADGGHTNLNGGGTTVIQHWPTYRKDKPDQAGSFQFRLLVGADAPINDAVMTVNLPDLPEGGEWRVGSVIQNSPTGQTWNYMRDYDNLPIIPEGVIEGSTLTYDLGDMPAHSGVTLMFSANNISYNQMMEFTQPEGGFYNDRFHVTAELTGEYAPGYVDDCAPAGNYDDSFTTPGETVTVNLNNEDSYPEGTTFVEYREGDQLIVIGIDEDGLEYAMLDWEASVDPVTGRLVVTPPAHAETGVYELIVKAQSPLSIDGVTEYEGYEIPARVHVLEVPNLDFDPAYDDSFTTPGQDVIVNLNGEVGIPAGSSFEVTDKPEGWTVVVDEQGRVTATPPADAPSGVTTVIVTITTPSGDTIEVPARIHVQAEPEISMETGYRDEDGNLYIENEDGISILDEDGNWTPVDELPENTQPGHVVIITDADGTTDEYFIPNGVDGADGEDAPETSIKLEKGENEGVPGTWVVTYVDANGDGEFAEDEEVSREFVADGKDGQDGTDGETPVIGENGNWYIGGEDTGVKAGCNCAPGKDGESITIADQGLTDEGDVWLLFSDGTRVVIPSGKDAETTPDEQGIEETDQASASSSANERCLPAALLAGAPLLLLLPLGVVSQLDLPIARQFNAQLAAANTEIQKSLGIFNQNNARSASAFNGQLAQFGQVGGMVGGALIGIAVLGLLAKYFVDNCAPVAEGEEAGSLALPEGFSGSSN